MRDHPSPTDGPDAVIFDMDGVLIDSEPLWRRAEIAIFADIGVALTEDDCRSTMGLRVDEVIHYWMNRRPWSGVSVAEVEARVVESVMALVLAEGQAMDGVAEALAFAESLDCEIGLASSSYPQIIDATLTALGLHGRFASVRSAENCAYGKPHPEVYLAAAGDLGARPDRCVAIEDSVTGMIAAKAARMRCVVIPERGGDPRFALADLQVSRLQELSACQPPEEPFFGF